MLGMKKSIFWILAFMIGVLLLTSIDFLSMTFVAYTFSKWSSIIIRIIICLPLLAFIFFSLKMAFLAIYQLSKRQVSVVNIMAVALIITETWLCIEFRIKNNSDVPNWLFLLIKADFILIAIQVLKIMYDEYESQKLIDSK
jgi:hypothetical protein